MKREVYKNIINNIIRLITLLIAVCIVSFVLVSISPIDPVQSYVGAGAAVSPVQRENIVEFWGLNKPPIERLISWATAIIKGDFGISLIYRRSVISIIYERFRLSLGLMLVAWILSTIIGYTLGIIMGVYRGRIGDKVIKMICLTLASTPTFWVGLLLLMIFSVWLRWFPIGLSVPAGMLSSDVTLLQRIHHMVLPAVTLSLTSFSSVALHTREKMISVLQSDFVLFARARGESERQIIKYHGIRNTILPATILQLASFSELFGGSLLVEQVFSYPGIGQVAVQSGLKGDIPLLLGVTIFSALFVFVGNLIANTIHGMVDPKVMEGR